MKKEELRAIQDQADCWEAVYSLCLKLGMKGYNKTGEQAVLSFIQGLHDKNSEKGWELSNFHQEQRDNFRGDGQW